MEYDSVTILILRSMNLNEVGHKDAHELKSTGNYMLSHHCCYTHHFRRLYSSSHKLVALLKFLHIIARISTHQQATSSSSFSEEAVTYITPYVLKNATKEELDSISTKPHEMPNHDELQVWVFFHWNLSSHDGLPYYKPIFYHNAGQNLEKYCSGSLWKAVHFVNSHFLLNVLNHF